MSTQKKSERERKKSVRSREMSSQNARSEPNVLITGTPGTGKTTTSEMVADLTGYRHVNIGQIVDERGLHEGRDTEYDCWLIDEDRVVDELESEMAAGGNVVDFHTCDFFPERWFDLVVVLRANNTVLFDRLKGKGYRENKVQENIECEIMQVVLDEARDSYPDELIVELQSDTFDQLESNAQRIKQWVLNWKNKHQH